MDNEESEVTGVDVERLLFLVQSNPIIYNHALKEHHNADVLAKIWADIGKELSIPGHVCKNKWYNLRNSYTRYLRDSKKPGSQGKKKKFYLADAMEFLRPWTGTGKKKARSAMRDATYDPEAASTSAHDTINVDSDEEEGGARAAPNYFWKKRQRQTPAELVASPMVEYLKTITNKRRNDDTKPDNEFLLFFKSLIPETDMLSERRKRKFRTTVMTTLHQLLEEQETEKESFAKSNPPQVPPSCSEANVQTNVEQYNNVYNNNNVYQPNGNQSNPSGYQFPHELRGANRLH